MSSTLMPEKKKPTGKRSAGEVTAEGGDPKLYTSTRLFTEDSHKLGQLAALRRESAADTFRAVFGKLLDAALIAAAEQTASELRKER